MKFYSVKIGTRTRAGNINVNYDFVAQSERSQNDVYIFYSNKYKGLAVSVEEITEIVKDEIPVVKSDDIYGLSAEEQKIRNLEREILKLKSEEFDRFEGSVIWNKISPEVIEKYGEMKKLHNEYGTKKNEVSEIVREFVKTKYNILDIHEVNIGKFDHNESRIPFIVRLNGLIKRKDNEL